MVSPSGSSAPEAAQVRVSPSLAPALCSSTTPLRGAVFWMILTAIFGMSSKLASCTLAIMYRTIHPDGHVTGGPMYYLEKGLEAKGLKPLGHTLAVLFAILCIGGALGGGATIGTSSKSAKAAQRAAARAADRTVSGRSLSSSNDSSA